MFYLPVVHKSPKYPESQPIKHVPFVCKQLLPLLQCPHVLLQSLPYVPFSQAIKRRSSHTLSTEIPSWCNFASLLSQQSEHYFSVQKILMHFMYFFLNLFSSLSFLFKQIYCVTYLNNKWVLLLQSFWYRGRKIVCISKVERGHI